VPPPPAWPACWVSLGAGRGGGALHAARCTVHPSAPGHTPPRSTDMSPDLSGEWPSAWSLATWNDLNAYYAAHGKQAQQLLPGVSARPPAPRDAPPAPLFAAFSSLLLARPPLLPGRAGRPRRAATRPGSHARRPRPPPTPPGGLA